MDHIQAGPSCYLEGIQSSGGPNSRPDYWNPKQLVYDVNIYIYKLCEAVIHGKTLENLVVSAFYSYNSLFSVIVTS